MGLWEGEVLWRLGVHSEVVKIGRGQREDSGIMGRGQRMDSNIMGRGSVKEWTVEL